MSQTDIFNHPVAVGKRLTSAQAALSIAPKVANNREKVLEVFEQYPDGLTSSQVAQIMNLELLQVRPRMTELIDLKLIVQTKEAKTNHRGNPELIHKIAGV